MQAGSGWHVALNGTKPVKTPKGFVLELPSRALAEALAEEWRSQEEFVKPLEMPLTTIGCTAVDLVRPDKQACIERIMPYLATDTLCFEDDSEVLAKRQASEWGPARQWFEEQFGVTLGVAKGILVPSHPETTLATIKRDLAQRDEWQLSALEFGTSSAKSLIVGMALVELSDVSVEVAHRWALLEELSQIDRWGMVEGEHDVSHQQSLRWLTAVREFAAKQREG